MTAADKQKPDAGPASIEVWPAVAKDSEDTAKQKAHTEFEPLESDGHVVHRFTRVLILFAQNTAHRCQRCTVHLHRFRVVA